MSATAHPGVQKVVVELNRRVGHLEPSDVDAVKEIVGEWRHLTAIDDQVVYLVAAETLDGLSEHLWVLDVLTVRNHLQLGLLVAVQPAIK